MGAAQTVLHIGLPLGLAITTSILGAREFGEDGAKFNAASNSTKYSELSKDYTVMLAAFVAFLQLFMGIVNAIAGYVTPEGDGADAVKKEIARTMYGRKLLAMLQATIASVLMGMLTTDKKAFADLPEQDVGDNNAYLAFFWISWITVLWTGIDSILIATQTTGAKISTRQSLVSFTLLLLATVGLMVLNTTTAPECDGAQPQPAGEFKCEIPGADCRFLCAAECAAESGCGSFSVGDKVCPYFAEKCGGDYLPSAADERTFAALITTAVSAVFVFVMMIMKSCCKRVSGPGTGGAGTVSFDGPRMAAVIEDFLAHIPLSIALYLSASYLGQQWLQGDQFSEIFPVLCILASFFSLTMAVEDGTEYKELPGNYEGQNKSNDPSEVLRIVLFAVIAVASMFVEGSDCSSHNAIKLMLSWAVFFVAIFASIRKVLGFVIGSLYNTLLKVLKLCMKEDSLKGLGDANLGGENDEETDVVNHRFNGFESAIIVLLAGALGSLSLVGDCAGGTKAIITLFSFSLVERLYKSFEDSQVEPKPQKTRTYVVLALLLTSLVLSALYFDKNGYDGCDSDECRIRAALLALKGLHLILSGVFGLTKLDGGFKKWFMLLRPLVASSVLFLDGWIMGIRVWDVDAWYHFGAVITYFSYEIVGNRYL